MKKSNHGFAKKVLAVFSSACILLMCFSTLGTLVFADDFTSTENQSVMKFDFEDCKVSSNAPHLIDSTTVGNNSTNKLKLTPSSKDAQNRKFEYTSAVEIKANNLYKISFDYYVTDYSKWSEVNFTVYDTSVYSPVAVVCGFNADFLKSNANEEANAWKKATAEFTTLFGSSNLKLSLQTKGLTDAVMYIDNIEITDMGVAETVGNYKYYANFDGETDKNYSSCEIVHKILDGKYSGSFLLKPEQAGLTYGRAPLTNMLLESGKQYTVSFDYYSDSNISMLQNFNLALGSYSGSGTMLSSSTSIVNLKEEVKLGESGTDGKWKNCEVKLKIGESESYSLGFQYSGDSGYSLYLDNIIVREYTPTERVWDKTVANKFAKGKGTSSEPYQISSAAELAKLVSEANNGIETGKGKYYILTNDIYLNDINQANWQESANSWYTTNSVDKLFCGNFDGQGHKVFGIFYSDDNKLNNNGLFPAIGNGATISNISIRNSVIRTTGNYAGGISGTCYLDPSVVSEKTIISACSVDETVQINAKYAGGLVGYARGRNQFVNCYSTAKISGTNAYGIYGMTYSNKLNKITKCYTKGCLPAPENNPPTYNDVYTTEYSAQNGITKVEALTKENMSAFDYGKIWIVKDEIPTLVTDEHNGDVNLDGVADKDDSNSIKKQLLGMEDTFSADVNRNGIVDICDLVALNQK